MYIFAVVPFVGTWIEMQRKQADKSKEKVVPFVGTWIEIHKSAIRTRG